MPEVKMSLNTLQDGAAAERFDISLAEVLRNIANPNTPEKFKRKIVLEVTLEPSEGHREDIWVTTKVTTKLAGLRAIETRGYVEETGEGGFMALETHRNQMKGQVSIEDNPAKMLLDAIDAATEEKPTTSNVRNIKAAGKQVAK